jgi:hypothetical protein
MDNKRPLIKVMITPTSFRDDQLIEALTEALTGVWHQLGCHSKELTQTKK